MNPLRHSLLFTQSVATLPLYYFLIFEYKIMENRGNLCGPIFVATHKSGLVKFADFFFIAHLSPTRFSHKTLFTFSQFWLWFIRDISHNKVFNTNYLNASPKFSIAILYINGSTSFNMFSKFSKGKLFFKEGNLRY